MVCLKQGMVVEEIIRGILHRFSPILVGFQEGRRVNDSQQYEIIIQD